MLQLLSVVNYSSRPTEHKGIKKPKRKTKFEAGQASSTPSPQEKKKKATRDSR